MSVCGSRSIRSGVFLGSAGLALLGCLLPSGAVAQASASAPAPGEGTAQIHRPSFEFTTNERFDASAIPAYGGEHPEVYSYIDAHRAEHLESLLRWIRQPSISAQNDGVQEMAALLRDDLEELGFQEAEVVPTSGHPGVWGYYDAGADRTLAVYMMYDVQPIEPEGWKVGAFDGALVDHPLGQALMARGATNQKGPQRAFLNAVAAILETRGRLPVNLMILAEGEEELGSVHYPELIDRFEARLKTANGVLFPANGQSVNGAVSMQMGVKGIVYFEMEAQGSERGGPREAGIHSSFQAITDAPVWRLIQALASLTTPDGNTIVVPGYYDGIRPPSEEEQRLINGMAEAWAEREPAVRQSLGVERWTDGVTGRESLARLFFNPTLNIDGIWSGYTGPGVKTILPHRATAKLDSRLVPGQTPEEALRLIRAHLDRQGFSDITIRRLTGYPAAQSSVESPFVRATIGAYRKYGLTPSVAPRTGASAPYYVFTERLKLPIVAGGMGHGGAQHAPNEFMIVDPKPGSKIAGLAGMEKFYVDLLYALAEVK